MLRTLLILATLLTPLIARGDEVRDSVLTVTCPMQERAYQERDDFHTVRISEGITAIPKYAFTACPNLRRVILPETINDIASLAFAYCCNLRNINIPSGVTHIGANCFSFCTALRHIVLPADIQELESYAFSDCRSLQAIVLPANDRLLGEMLLAGCINLRSITVESVTPPTFDCNSQPFDPDETDLFDRVVLMVPAESVDIYKQAQGWKLFKNIYQTDKI